MGKSIRNGRVSGMMALPPGTLEGATAVFFDMDGVLARYERHAYEKYDPDLPPLYEQEDLHYYRTCEPDSAAIALLEYLTGLGIPCWALTSVKPSIPWARYDKIYWLMKHTRQFDAARRTIIADGDKAQVVKAREKICRLDRGMILLDDFNKNLWDWERAGGTAVKYLNGVNSTGSFDGPHIDARDGRLSGFPAL